ncbi:septal ring lytic transglycosylase RlpA family lipoprotein [Siphonobacter sp. BAB-5385]|uniref:Probable endolytic peptidoglycan transglycosylase RlpA n=1 Tax=Siphonobacter curvatus TaxID=2094562 RepID=A0A2S7IMT4_9BACT|nr:MULTISPECIES: septal ring lytic transglycosylase RlpA family protein [Siphonobacter]OZI09641.1 septal ring lytic transglycosylase RlpA family lipoprotein [Siphonobacter sp. BAB-5385]PMD96938.1 septal ring lytic transglycosylase RlpA family lipoprotein [Siphonobacter sp. BAB-5405]PQA58959.1 septal ring lytic transglycosylase RlpA family protein [Siphonobacter curvatus]
MNIWTRRAVTAMLLNLSILPCIAQAHYSVYYKKYPPVKKPLGKEYRGRATYYGKQYFGRITASGERLKNGTCAHKTLPFGSMVEVTNLKNGRKTIVRVIDRGPFGKNRDIDLSFDAAKKLGMTQAGVAQVNLRVVGTNGIVLLRPNKYLLEDNATITARADMAALE